MEKRNAQIKIGNKVRLIRMQGEEQMPAGLTGTVEFIDGLGQIHVKWENGSSLALIPETDKFVIESEIESEKDDR